MTSSTRSKRSLGISSYTSNMLGFTIPMFIPAFMAWYKNTECIASRTGLLPLKLKETLLTPPLTLQEGKFSLTQAVAFIKSSAFNLCSSIPVAPAPVQPVQHRRVRGRLSRFRGAGNYPPATGHPHLGAGGHLPDLARLPGPETGRHRPETLFRAASRGRPQSGAQFRQPGQWLHAAEHRLPEGGTGADPRPY